MKTLAHTAARRMPLVVVLSGLLLALTLLLAPYTSKAASVVVNPTASEEPSWVREPNLLLGKEFVLLADYYFTGRTDHREIAPVWHPQVARVDRIEKLENAKGFRVHITITSDDSAAQGYFEVQHIADLSRQMLIHL